MWRNVRPLRINGPALPSQKKVNFFKDFWVTPPPPRGMEQSSCPPSDKGYLGFGMYKYGLYIYTGTAYNDKITHLFPKVPLSPGKGVPNLYTPFHGHVRIFGNTCHFTTACPPAAPDVVCSSLMFRIYPRTDG